MEEAFYIVAIVLAGLGAILPLTNQPATYANGLLCGAVAFFAAAHLVAFV